jgi:hypothetical protein
VTISNVWTLAILLGGFYAKGKSCRQGKIKCLAYAAYSQWILQVLSLFWLIGWLDALYYARAREQMDHTNTVDSPEAEETDNLQKHPIRNINLGSVDGG